MTNKHVRFSSLITSSLFYSSTMIVLFTSVVVLADLVVFNDSTPYRFVMLPDSALGLFAVSMLLVGAATKKRVLIYGGIAVVALLVGASLLWHMPATSVANVSWLSGQSRLPLWQGIALVLLCLPWLSRRRGKAAVGVSVFSVIQLLANLVVIVICLMVLLAQVTALSWLNLSPSTAASLYMAISLFLLAIASFCVPYIKWRYAEQYLSKSGWLLVSFIGLLSIIVWFNYAYQLPTKISQAASAIAGQMQHNVDQIVAEQRGLMNRLAERITAAEAELPAAYYETEFNSYLRDFPYMDYLAVQGVGNEILHAKAQYSTELVWFNHYLLQQSAVSGIPSISHTQPELTLHYDSVIDHAFIIISLPADNRLGVTRLVAAVDFSRAMADIISDLVPPGYFVQLLQPTQQSMIYDSASAVANLVAVGSYQITLPAKLHWQLHIHTHQQTVFTSHLITAGLILLAGWLITWLIMLSQKLYQQSQRHRLHLMASNNKLQRNIAELQRLQLQQQQIMSNSADMICVIDSQGYFVEVSASCQQVLGYRADELVGKAFIDFVHQDDKVITENEVRQVVDAAKLTSDFRNRYLRKDGTVVHLMWGGNYVARQGLMYVIARNINDMVNAEQYQAVQQSILRMISTERPLPDILNRICQMAEQQSSMVRATVMLKQHDVLYLEAAPSLSVAYKTAIRHLPIADNVASCGTAAYQKSLVLVNDIATDDRWRELAPVALADGMLACWSMPMISAQDEVLGTIDLYCSEARAASKEELELMLNCSRFAAVALERSVHKRQLQQSDQRYHSLFHFNPEPVYVINPEGCFVDMNEAGCQMLESDITDITGMHFDKVILPEHLPQVEQYFANVLAGNAERFEASIINVTGQQIELYISLVPNWQDGQVAEVIGMSKDITQRLKAEQQLRLFKRAVDATSNGITIADLTKPDQPVSYVNAAFEKLTGYNAEEIIGRNCRILQGAEPDAVAVNQIRRAIEERQECSVVLKNYRKDNSLFWNQLFLAPVPNEYGDITHYIGVQTDVTPQKKFEQELAYNASHDLLTGLPNRALLQDRLAQSCQVGLRREQHVAVLFIDLDGFKAINDSLGHMTGDEVLRQISQRITSCIRPGDTLARIGGDEFVLLLTELNATDVQGEVNAVAERILVAVAGPLTVSGKELHISASIGISTTARQLTEPMQLVQQADLAMYKAKQLGRNNYQWYSSELDSATAQQLDLRAQLKKAIANEEFELYYQPQIDAVSGDIVGLEALLRWPHPTLGFISPDEFIPLAEYSGEIVPLGKWVINKASQYNKSLMERGIATVVMAVNVSSIQFSRVSFVTDLRQSIEATGLAANWFEIELTESLLFENTEQVILKLQELRQLGVKVSIDDFGTGFSSLSYLKRLPIDKLKIDRAFIRDIVSDKRDAAISKAIIGLAHHLDIKVIAEGVESEAQAALLRKNLCDEFQGYYYGRPMPADKLEHYLQNYQQTRLIRPVAVSGTKSILLVDDEENILSALSRLLRKEGYQILTSSSAAQAFEILALHQVQVIVSDQRMPGMSGTEFLSQVKDMYPDTIRIVLSGYTDLKSVTEAINKGAIYKFMTKPWQDDELRQEIKKAFLKHQQQVTDKAEKL
ncbi:EAL domain-containing protein [Arsukibacterium sp.]|uniref:EAL domain-containing protein n=1 Tax=Arsukibacterium sp. TaxID=1977258 RepID=UPI001BD3EFA1|nr:EAL domain-containing protein [Arsukibacterium sp.]